MDDENKLPLKRVELSLSKFNDVAIPHHLDLLRQHRTNIIKYEESGDYSRVRSEQTHARRVTSQLRSLLSEMETLRRQVKSTDLKKFDSATQRSRDLTLKSIMDYLETSPLSVNRQPLEDNVAGSAISTDSVGLVAHLKENSNEDDEVGLIQLQVEEDYGKSVAEREAVLRGWSELQEELRALHELWAHIHSVAKIQAERVEAIQSTVETASENVNIARMDLATAERLRGTAWAVGGAAAGALAGGPIGLIVGAKLAAITALAGSAIGYIGGSLLANKRRIQITNLDEQIVATQSDKKTE